jgi:hypothetical protein
MPRDDVVVRAESGSAHKEHVPPEDVHERPGSENERRGSTHGRIAPDDQDDDSGCT